MANPSDEEPGAPGERRRRVDGPPLDLNVGDPASSAASPDDPGVELAPSPDNPAAEFDTLKMEWEELRAERANQFARNASISIVATALLGFEGVIITRIPDLHVQTGLRTASMIIMGISIVFLLDCLLDMPGRGPLAWRLRGRSLRAHVPSELRDKIEPLRKEAAVLWLVTQSQEMIDENHDLLITKRRRTLHTAVWFFAIALFLLAVAALHDWMTPWFHLNGYWRPSTG